MKNLKKVLALTLSMTMAFTMFVTGAGAAFTDQADIKAVEAVNMLTTLGVIDGEPDGSFQPDGTVTRAQMAKMIYVIMSGGDKNADAYASMPTSFQDINGHWAAGYIKFCQSNGIIAGKTATQFDPDALVTGTEAAKMLLVVMGYLPDKAQLTGPSWAQNTIGTATKAGLLQDVPSSMTEGMPRQYAAQIIYNTLDAWRVRWSTDAGSFDYFLNNDQKETVGYQYLKLTKDIGSMIEIDKDTLTINISKNDAPDSVHGTDNNGKYVSSDVTFTKLTTDYSSLLGQKVKVLSKDGKTNDVLGVYAAEDNTSYTVNAVDVESDGAKVKFGGKSYSLENTKNDRNEITVYSVDYKGKAWTGDDSTQDSEFFDNWDQTAATMTFVDSDGNGKLDAVIITGLRGAKVTYVSSSQIIAGTTYKFDDENIEDGLKVDDWAVISYDRFNDCAKIVKADTITGTLTGKKTGSNDNGTFNKYQIDSTWYNEADDSTTDINTVKAGDKVEAVAVNGVMYFVKRTSGSTNGDLTDVALIVSAKDDSLSGKQVKLQFFNDTTKVVDFDTDANGSGDIRWNDLVNNRIGDVLEYSISSDKYSFQELKLYNSSNKDNKDYYGDYSYIGSGALGSSHDKIDGLKIADNAKVILYTANANDTKVITGKQFKAISDTSKVASNANYQAFQADVDGLTQIGALTVEAKAMPDSYATNDNYAYIVKDGYFSRGSSEITYTIWNGSENITVVENHSSVSDRKKGMVIGYKTLKGNDDNDTKTIDDVDKLDMQPNAVTSVNGAKTKYTLDQSVKGFKDFEVGADSTILYVDSDNDDDMSIGMESGDIRKADKDENGDLMLNVLAYGDGTDTTELLVVDAQNEMVGPYVDEYKKGQTAAKISATADDNNAKVEPVYGTVSGNFVYEVEASNQDKAPVINVVVNDKNGDDKTADFTITGNGTMTLTDKAGTATVTVATTATAAAGDYTVVISNGSDKVASFTDIKVAPATLADANALVFAAAQPAATNRLSSVVTAADDGNSGAMFEAKYSWTVNGIDENGNYVLQTTDVLELTVTLTPSANYVFADTVATTTTLTDAAGNAVNGVATVKDGVVTVVYTFPAI